MTATVAALLVVAFLTVGGHAVFIRIAADPVCLAEEMSGPTDVVTVEWARRKSTFGNTPINVAVSAVPSATVVHGDVLSDSSGSFSFKGNEKDIGQYVICFSSLIGSAFGSHEATTIDLSVAVDHHDRRRRMPDVVAGITRNKAPSGEEVFVFTDTDGQQKETLRTKDYIDRVTGTLDQIDKELADLQTELGLFWGRNERSRSTSESTFERVWGFSAVTIGVVAVTGYLQFMFLKMFLRAKKLV